MWDLNGVINRRNVSRPSIRWGSHREWKRVRNRDWANHRDWVNRNWVNRNWVKRMSFNPCTATMKTRTRQMKKQEWRVNRKRKDIAFDLVSAKIVMPNQTEAFVSSFFPGAFDSKLKPVWKVEMKFEFKFSSTSKMCFEDSWSFALWRLDGSYSLSCSSVSTVETTTTTTENNIHLQRIHCGEDVEKVCSRSQSLSISIEKCNRTISRIERQRHEKSWKVSNRKSSLRFREYVVFGSYHSLISLNIKKYLPALRARTQVHRRKCNACKQRRSAQCAFAPSFSTAREYCACRLAMDEIDQAANDTWIRCDKAYRCNWWIHPKCFEDLNLEEISDKEKFVCPMCLCSTKTLRPPIAFEIFRSETTSEPRDWNSLDDEQKRVYKKKEENAKMKWNFERLLRANTDDLLCQEQKCESRLGRPYWFGAKILLSACRIVRNQSSFSNFWTSSCCSGRLFENTFEKKVLWGTFLTMMFESSYFHLHTHTHTTDMRAVSNHKRLCSLYLLLGQT